jgi:hypothetical protein
MFDQVFWRGTSGQINRWRRNTLGLPSTSLDRMEPHKIPFLYNFSPTVVPTPLDWPEWIRITGAWRAAVLLNAPADMRCSWSCSFPPACAASLSWARRILVLG